MRKYNIRQGDTILKIAQKYRLPWEKIWDDPQNKELRDSREDDPDLLMPGDVIVIPEIETKKVDCATEKKHRFKAKVPKREFYLELIDSEGELLGDHTYKLKIEHQIFEGDCSEPIDIDLPRSATSGELIIFTEDKIEIDKINLQFDHIDPFVEVDESVSSIQARLNNLGYFSGAVDGKLGELTEQAVRRFQINNDMEVTGKCQDIIEKLKELYGC